MSYFLHYIAICIRYWALSSLLLKGYWFRKWWAEMYRQPRRTARPRRHVCSNPIKPPASRHWEQKQWLIFRRSDPELRLSWIKSLLKKKKDFFLLKPVMSRFGPDSPQRDIYGSKMLLLLTFTQLIFVRFCRILKADGKCVIIAEKKVSVFCHDEKNPHYLLSMKQPQKSYLQYFYS